MRAVVQRVSGATIKIERKTIACCGRGLVVLLGIAEGDSVKDAEWIASKCVHMRVFPDEAGIMNRSLLDIGGDLLLVSQFTLLGDVRHGRRPSYSRAARPEEARLLYEQAILIFQDLCPRLETGWFQSEMAVTLTNDGPVTILLDSHREF